MAANTCFHTSVSCCREGLGFLRPMKLRTPVMSRKRSSIIQAALGPGVGLAVAQQAFAFGAVVIGEGFYTRSQIPELARGRPELATMGISASLLFLAGALLTSENGVLEPVGLIAGVAASIYLIYSSYRRFDSVEGDPLAWPGPKVWPAGMGLASSLVFLAMAEGLSQL